jgi:hypothetical protein
MAQSKKDNVIKKEPKATHEFQVIKADGSLGEKVTKPLSPEHTRRLAAYMLDQGLLSDEQMRQVIDSTRKQEERDGK